MDKSVNETVTNQSLRSPPRRRRSTFFERRDSIAPQPLTENIIYSNTCQRNPVTDENSDADLLRYFEKLQKEKEDWKKEVKERRNKYHDLKQQYQISAKAPSRTLMPFSELTSEDINFMKSKPNISKLIESQMKLHKSIKETKALYRRANELDDVLLSYCEEKVVKITDYILDNSTIDPN